ncbi:MAG TPA: DNA methyltransferase [Phycisphaerae bacterium]|nr:DNA methyltransferase [Phycisphaerae bacterium]
MTPAEFVQKWRRTQLPERAASQEHFNDLCRLLGQPTPAEHDATGAEYTFEKGVAVTGPASAGAKGKYGFADVWWKGKFGWEYKRKDKYKDLAEAYRELLQYREALGNPPLLVVCDIARTEIHTNFTGTAKQVHVVELDKLAEPQSLDLLRRVFTDPESFCPTVTVEAVTEQVADKFAAVAESLRTAGHDPHTAAHFLMKCMFCLFAEDVDLLPQKVFTRMLDQWHDDPKALRDRMTDLFGCMRAGGAFGNAPIPNFNGGLFDDAPALALSDNDIATMRIAARQDWGSIQPAIFGTLFERSLNPSKRSQIGAHYTSPQDILLVVEPVVMAPLRREWQAVKDRVEKQLDRRRSAKTAATRRKADDRINHLLQDFDHRLASVRVLDPACGSGNFLYVAIQQLLHLEKEVTTYAARPDVGQRFLPRVRPTQLHGIELNPYAAELARIVIWIGYLQWMRDNGFNPPRDPILEPLEAIEGRDAILDRSQPILRAPGDWPQADFIIGNPPFLGSKLFRKYELDDDYLQDLYRTYELPNASDLCCYWFEKARLAIKRHPSTRAGLLATQGIRGGANRRVLERIKQTGDIFMAWSDRPWVLDGAAVHVSILGFDDGSETERILDGNPVTRINADLTADVDTASAKRLPENAGIAFMGDTKGGSFDIRPQEAMHLLRQPNPNGKPNSDVLCPWVNGSDITKRCRGMWIVDFGCDMPQHEAAGYEAPFKVLVDRVRPMRIKNRRKAYAERWWLHVEPRPAMRKAMSQMPRVLVTTGIAKHRLFRWENPCLLPDHATFLFARSDDYFLGLLQSSIHTL